MRCSDSSCNSLHNAIASPRCVLGARYAGVADRVGNALEDSRPLENTIFTSKAISKMSVKPDTETILTANQQTLNDLWEEHVRDEFTTRDTEATLRTMVPDAYVNHVPVMTGGVGHSALREFYSRRFIPQMPPDTEIVPVSRTIGTDQLVDEMIFRFTHTMEMDWLLPGVPPTGKRVEIPLVAIVHFREGKLAHEHIYWDQASVLVQLGILSANGLPVAGVEIARKVLDPSLPSNQLMKRP